MQSPFNDIPGLLRETANRYEETTDEVLFRNPLLDPVPSFAGEENEFSDESFPGSMSLDAGAHSTVSFEEEGEDMYETGEWNTTIAENDLVPGDKAYFPSGEYLVVIDHNTGKDQEHWDSPGSGNPLLDTSGANQEKYLSKNFKVKEFAMRNQAEARIDIKLVQTLQTIRDAIGSPLTITSGYRSYLYNKNLYAGRIQAWKERKAKGEKVGKEPIWTSTSRHIAGSAADFHVAGMDGKSLAKKVIDILGCSVYGIGLGGDYIHLDVFRKTFYVWNYSNVPDSWITEISDYYKNCQSPRSAPAATPSNPAPVAADRSKAIRLNAFYQQNLGWDQYMDQVNDLLLPFSGYSNVSLGEEALANAVHNWQLSRGFSAKQADGVIGPHTWQIMKPLLGGGITTQAAPPASPAPAASASSIDRQIVSNIDQYAQFIDSISNSNNINPTIVRGVIAAESGGNANAGAGHSGYKGLMQAYTTTDQLDPATSIQKGIEKIIYFRDKLLDPALSKAGIAKAQIDEETYYKMILACYNAGHVTVIKAIQYAAASGSWRNWLDAANYERALLFSGGYAQYDACSKGSAASVIQQAKAERLSYKFKTDHWPTEPDPPAWNVVSASISSILRCWIDTKFRNTGVYLDKFIRYYQYYQAAAQPVSKEYYNEYELEGEFEDREDQFESEYETPLYEQEHDELYKCKPPGRAYETYEDYEDEIKDTLFSNEFDVDPKYGMTYYLNVPVEKGFLPRTGVFIPAGFNNTQQVDVVFYLHGLITNDQPDLNRDFPLKGIQAYWEIYSNIRLYFASSGKNAILIAPTLGKDSQHQYGNLGNRSGFDQYITDCFKELVSLGKLPAGASPNRIILAAHSGGGGPLSGILNANNSLLNNLNEVWGFDCLYGYPFDTWLNNHPTIPFYHYWSSSCITDEKCPHKRGEKLQNAYTNFHNIAPVGKIKHRDIIENAWNNDINKRVWFGAAQTAYIPVISDAINLANNITSYGNMAVETLQKWSQLDPYKKAAIMVTSGDQTITDQKVLEIGIAQQVTDKNELTNLVFFKRHKDYIGRKLQKSDPQTLKDEWTNILNTIVEPFLQQSKPPAVSTPLSMNVAADYAKMNLQSLGLSADAFRVACNGYGKLNSQGLLKNNRILSIADFTQSSANNRLYILDMINKQVILQTKVAHGKNSVKPGDDQSHATQFSNNPGSNQSSLGFYITLNTFTSKIHGTALILEGMEKGFNDNARKRSIVLHGATYVKAGPPDYTGKSLGCPAVPAEQHEQIVNLLKDGTCLFLYYNDPNYLSTSTLAGNA